MSRIRCIIHWWRNYFSKTTSEHEIHLKQTMELLREAGFKISETKCTLRKMAVEFLGFRVSNNDIAPVQPNLWNLKRPTNSKELHRFMGTIAFYQSMMPRLSETRLFSMTWLQLTTNRSYLHNRWRNHPIDSGGESLTSDNSTSDWPTWGTAKTLFQISSPDQPTNITKKQKSTS